MRLLEWALIHSDTQIHTQIHQECKLTKSLGKEVIRRTEEETFRSHKAKALLMLLKPQSRICRLKEKMHFCCLRHPACGICYGSLS